ncbi:MAG: trigger factor [SAR324 cluster bacterium]|nr:trigger factor [SAR324 cluster bacterium]
MQLNVEELSSLKRKISVEVPLLEVEATYNQVFSQISGHIQVKGFRPGKFPRKMAEKRFQDLMKQEATRSLLPKYFQQALDEMKVRPATQPQFDNLEIDKSQPFKFEAEFEIVPTFEPPPISEISIDEKQVEITKKDVDARIEELRKSRAEMDDKGDAAAEAGDVVTVDFEGKLKGEPFEGNSGTDQRIELGAGSFLEDFEKPLLGAVAGESKTAKVKFPKNYGEATLAGKTAQFEMQVKKVERKVLPELNEAFFSQFGQFDSLEMFLENVEQQLGKEQERNNQMEYQQLITDQIKEKMSFDVPDTLVNQLLDEFEHQLTHNDPDALKDKKNLAKLKKEETEKIKGNLRLNYVVDEWSRRHEISVTKEEVQQRFFMQAYMMQKNPSELINTQYGEMMLFQIEQQLLTGKVLEDVCNRVLGKTPAEDASKGDAQQNTQPGAAAAEGVEPESEPAPEQERPAVDEGQEAPAAEEQSGGEG